MSRFRDVLLERYRCGSKLSLKRYTYRGHRYIQSIVIKNYMYTGDFLY